MSSINILIIFIYLIFVLFQFNSCQQQCSKREEKCNDSDKKCCSGLNCKNKRIKNGIFVYKCSYGACVNLDNPCDDNGRGCCYGLKCDPLSSKCKKCLVNGSKSDWAADCCSGERDGTTGKCYSDQ
ncbi:unnamed protein product [Meloidogyne enterolobii]|uniref:Uncharacterized protein n=1 Tax=Meloidogyne enterolobii TaxID=390850 RepID=A0ACB0ZGP7_MELEN